MNIMQPVRTTADNSCMSLPRMVVPGGTYHVTRTGSPSQSFNATLLVNPNAVLDKIVYTLTNPVKDGLVSDYRKWPGFNTRPSDWRGSVRRVKRPDYYFKNTPAEIEYQITAPSQLGNGDIEALIAEVEGAIRERQSQAATDLASQKRTFVGAKSIMRTNPLDSPNSARAVGKLNPQIAAGGDKKALNRATRALQAFRIAYRKAWILFKRGAKAVVFPGGTLLMHRRYGLPCDPLDASFFCQLAVR